MDPVISSCIEESKKSAVELKSFSFQQDPSDDKACHCVDNTLYIIAVVSNTRRFKRRYELFRKFVAHIQSFKGVELRIVELAFGDRPAEIVPPEATGCTNHLLLYSKDEVWSKESLINIGVSRLPRTWKYVCWADADIMFANSDWVSETIHMLQHHPVVQCFETAADLGPTGRITAVHYGFGYCLQRDGKIDPIQPYGGKYHSGYVWACTRDFWNRMGGLIDWSCLGSGDHLMCMAWIGQVDQAVHNGVSDEFKKRARVFQQRLGGKIDVGYTKGTILHAFHGKKKNRKYVERWQVLVDNKFDPDIHLCYDWQGLIVFSTLCPPKLKHDIGNYYIQRNEDSIDDDERL
jgi:hypothetical protein